MRGAWGVLYIRHRVQLSVGMFGSLTDGTEGDIGLCREVVVEKAGGWVVLGRGRLQKSCWETVSLLRGHGRVLGENSSLLLSTPP